MATQFVLGSYNLPVGLTHRSDEHSRNPMVAGLPRSDGARVSLGYLKERRFTLEGGIWKPLGENAAAVGLGAQFSERGAVERRAARRGE